MPARALSIKLSQNRTQTMLTLYGATTDIEEMFRIHDFNTVVASDGRGTVRVIPSERAPADLLDDTGSDDDLDCQLGSGWELLRGHSGQHGYDGPVMHSSEFVSGGLAQWIGQTSGLFVCLIVTEEVDTFYSDVAEWETENLPVGWAVAFKPLSAAEASALVHPW